MNIERFDKNMENKGREYAIAYELGFFEGRCINAVRLYMTGCTQDDLLYVTDGDKICCAIAVAICDEDYQEGQRVLQIYVHEVLNRGYRYIYSCDAIWNISEMECQKSMKEILRYISPSL